MPSVTRMLLALGVCLTPAVAAQQQEVEPNDNVSQAMPVTRGGWVNASIRPYNQTTSERDFDYYQITANAGDTIFVDVDADEFDSKMNMGLTLYASDGTTVVAQNDDWDGMDPHLEYVVARTGTYYVLAGTSLETTPWGEAKWYTLHFSQVTCLPDFGEPNNTAQTATTVAVGQEIRSDSCPGEDVDFFKYTLDPGTYEFDFWMEPHERPAFGSAVEIAGWIELYGTDGRTKLAATMGEETPDRIEYTVQTRGTYYIRADIWPGGIRYRYRLNSKKMGGTAPADPITQRAEITPGYWGDAGAAVDPHGDILVSGLNGGIWWLTIGGRKEKVNASVEFPAGMAYDADGNLLIVNATGGYANTSTDGGVFTFTPSGQTTRLVTDKRADGGIAISRDGSFWLTSYSAKALLHYSAQGTLLATYDVTAASGIDGPRFVALGPSGDPYFATSLDIYRLRNGTAELVIHYDRTAGTPAADMGSFAFDTQGNIYVPNAAAGVLNLHDSNGKFLETIAREPDAPSRVLFGRNPDGSTNARLFAIDGGKLIEFNPAGIRAPGLPVQFDRQQPQQQQDPAIADAVADLLGGTALSAAQRSLLDERGNKNGHYDVGDLRALLQRIGTLTPPQPRD